MFFFGYLENAGELGKVICMLYALKSIGMLLLCVYLRVAILESKYAEKCDLSKYVHVFEPPSRVDGWQMPCRV